MEEVKNLLDECVSLQKEEDSYKDECQRAGTNYYWGDKYEETRRRINNRRGTIENLLKKAPHVIIKNADKLVGSVCYTGLHTTLADVYCSTLDQLPIESRGRIVTLPYYINLDGTVIPVKTGKGLQYQIQNKDGVICIRPHNLIDEYVKHELGLKEQ